jgi:hypothetical protein
VEKRSLVYPALVGRRLQKIEVSENGHLYFHFANGYVYVSVEEMNHGQWVPKIQFEPRAEKSEPLVIPSK